jgi:SAM-dependent methyltransferase
VEEEIISELKKTWLVIADIWEHLRATPFEEVVRFCSTWEKPRRVLDLGCSNARNLIPFLEREFPCFGVDFSKSMLRRAKLFLRGKGFKANFVVADVRFLPFKQRVFECVLCTRVLHHIPTRNLRKIVLEELKKILRRRGKLLFVVWRRYFPQFTFDWFLSLFEKKFEFGDVYKKWKYHGRTYKRFYHLFSAKEFEEELNEVKLKIEVFYSSNGSLIAVCKL